MSSEKEQSPLLIQRKRARSRVVVEPNVIRRPRRGATPSENEGPTPGMPQSPTPGSNPPPRADAGLSPERKRWKEMTEGVTSIHGRPFNPISTYHEGDILLHKQFGMGVVETVDQENLVLTALFRDGVETLTLEVEDY